MCCDFGILMVLLFFINIFVMVEVVVRKMGLLLFLDEVNVRLFMRLWMGFCLDMLWSWDG